MTRKEINKLCIQEVDKHHCLMLELATGFGKTKLAIDLVNHVVAKEYHNRTPTLLLLVAKKVHKISWQEEFDKWGGINADVTMECYESLRKHEDEHFDFIILDEVHHVKSEMRMQLLETLHYGYMFGLSATIPRTLKTYLKRKYSAKMVSCDITEAIEDDVLPEPRILLFPLTLDNVNPTETWEVNPKAKGPIHMGVFVDKWKYKRNKQHALLSCTQAQKIQEQNSLVLWAKNRYMSTGSPAMKNLWLHHAGKRLEYLSTFKIPVIKEILTRLRNRRTITFCKSIEQTESLGRNCIHSKKGDAEEIFRKFNSKKIKHITAVNILNENANLVDCKYAIFANLSSSEIIIPQRLGRSLRHKSPVIIVPFYKDTREEEIVKKMFSGYNGKFMHTISSINDIK